MNAPQAYRNPSPLLQELLAAGMMRVSTDGLSVLNPDGSTFASKCAAPTIDPDGGEFGSGDVTLACDTDGASLYYEWDADPNTDSTLYTVPFAAQSGQLRVLAVRPGKLDSGVVAADFVVNGQVATPAFAPPAGAVAADTEVTITCATAGAVIHFTTDDSEPTELSPVYDAPVVIGEATTVKAIAVKPLFDDSAVGSAAYTIAP